MADDFVDGDIFDPEMPAAMDDAYRADVEASNETVSRYIRERKRAYSAVFSTGGCTEADLQLVLDDLAAFCRAYTPTFHPTNPKVQDLLEGRREVYYRVADFTRVDHDTLYRRHMNAQINGTRQS